MMPCKIFAQGQSAISIDESSTEKRLTDPTQSGMA